MAKKMIRGYCAACGLDVLAVGDDLLQEAYIELLLKIRKAESEADIPFAKLSIHGAICAALRHMAAVYIPKHAQRAFRNAYRTESLEDLIDSAHPTSEEDMVFIAALGAFLEGRSERERFVLTKKLEDCPHREIVSHQGIHSEMTVTRTLRKLREDLMSLLSAD